MSYENKTSNKTVFLADEVTGRASYASDNMRYVCL